MASNYSTPLGSRLGKHLYCKNASLLNLDMLCLREQRAQIFETALIAHLRHMSVCIYPRVAKYPRNAQLRVLLDMARGCNWSPPASMDRQCRHEKRSLLHCSGGTAYLVHKFWYKRSTYSKIRGNQLDKDFPGNSLVGPSALGSPFLHAQPAVRYCRCVGAILARTLLSTRSIDSNLPGNPLDMAHCCKPLPPVKVDMPGLHRMHSA